MGGFNLPPGVTSRMIEKSVGVGALCECCGSHADECICPECPTCGETGNRACYGYNDLMKPSNDCRQYYNKAQRIGQAKRRILDFEDAITEEVQYIAWLDSKLDDWIDKEDP